MRDNLARLQTSEHVDSIGPPLRTHYDAGFLRLVPPLVDVPDSPVLTAFSRAVEATWIDSDARPPSLEARNETILEHYPLVRMLAGQLARRLPASVDLDDLVGMGTLGLIDAVTRFDPNRGVPIRAWSELRIRGAMVDGMRGTDGTPRSVRQRGTRLEHARARWIQEHGRAHPTDGDLARQLGVGTETYARLRRNAVPVVEVSLDAPANAHEGVTVGDLLADPGANAEELLILRDEQEAMARALDALPARERAVTTMHYDDGKKLREIGCALGVTESRACQIHARAVRRLRETIHETAKP